MVSSPFYNISSISVLGFTDNQLSGSLPANIGLTLPNLQVFDIALNEFFGTIPSSLCNASRHQILDLGDNNFAGSVPTNLGNLLHLEWLNIGPNKLGRDLDFLTSPRNCSKLGSLDFTSNQFRDVLPNSIGNLPTQLHGLYFGGNQISGMIPATLHNLINLVILGMEGNF